MINTVIMNGPPRSGKDHAAKFLCNKYGWNHLEFKHQLFVETCERFGVSLSWFMEDYDTNKDEPQAELEGMSKRQALIDTSENHIKLTKGKDYFGVCASNKLVEGVNVFSDGGFVEELQPIVEKSDNVIIVQIYRPGCSFDNDSRQYLDESVLRGKLDTRKISWFSVNNATSKKYFETVVDNQVRCILDGETRKEAEAIVALSKSLVDDHSKAYKLIEAESLLGMIQLCQTLSDLIFIFRCLVSKNYHISHRGVIYDSADILELLEQLKMIRRELPYNFAYKPFTRAFGLQAMVKSLCELKDGE